MSIILPSAPRCSLASGLANVGIPMTMQYHPLLCLALGNSCMSSLVHFNITETTASLTLEARYYRIFMYHYSLALRRASFLMVNSSWTKSHVDAILNHHDTPLGIIHSLLSIPALPFSLLLTSNPRHEAPKSAGIVYPPCETDELTGFPLEGRERVILSLAQFR